MVWPGITWEPIFDNYASASIGDVAIFQKNPDIIWAGTDDGNIRLTRDGGRTWGNVRPNIGGVPAGLWVSRVEASHFDEGTCHATFDGHRSDNFLPWVFKTTDFGKTWRSIASNLPDGQVAYVIREDPVNRNLLFLGTEFGLFISTNGGGQWEGFMNNLPTVAVHDILIHPLYKDVVIGTHGRGIWICEDISAPQQMRVPVMSSPAFLFDARPATQWFSISQGGSRGQFLFQGQNPPAGALIHCFLGAGTQEGTLEISDPSGELTLRRQLKGKPGVNRLVWGFQFDPLELTESEKKLLEDYLKASSGEERGRLSDELERSLKNRGKRYAGINRGERELNRIPAQPGVFKMTLRAAGRSWVKPLTVRKDPILK